MEIASRRLWQAFGKYLRLPRHTDLAINKKNGARVALRFLSLQTLCGDMPHYVLFSLESELSAKTDSVVCLVGIG